MAAKTIRLIRDEGGGGGREVIYLSLHCHHQNDSCTKMGSNESHFNVSLIVRVSNLVFTPSQPLRSYQGEIVKDKVARQCPQATNFEEKGEPKRIRTEVPLLTSLTPYH